MWTSEYKKEFKGVSDEAIWKAWVDVNNWPQWDRELETTRLEGAFEEGARFLLRPKGGPNVTIEITKVAAPYVFEDVTKFPLARMHDYHEIEKTAEGILLKSRISVTGPLGWLWKRIVAQGVADGVPAQMEALVDYVKSQS